jgi:ribulose-phosphate 3-epimerase
MPEGYEIQRVADAEALAVAAAGLFVRLARKAVADRGRFAVALSGGTTPRRMLATLATAPFRDRVAWEKVDVFWGDERAVQPDHADANYRMARETLLDAVPVSADRVHRMPAERADRDAAAADYEATIARVLGGDSAAPPALDLVLLGMGADGHTASLFPNATVASDRWVVAADGPASGVARLTMTPALVNRAACVAFLVSGADKAERVAEVLEGPADPDRLPSQRIRAASGRTIWLVDRAASAALAGHEARRVRLAPSILAADFARLGEHVAASADAGAARVHVDVMDGHFVPNISIGTVVVKSLRRVTHLPLETHLMITDPDRYAEAFVESGSDSILFHQEVAADPIALAAKIRALGASPGIVINPDTPAAAIADVIPHVDLALVMTVHPGFGGQAFIDAMLPKITEVREMIDRTNPTCDLEVDGGIGPRTIARAVDAGARVLVAGSAVFGRADGVAAAMRDLLARSTDSSGRSPSGSPAAV